MNFLKPSSWLFFVVFALISLSASTVFAWDGYISGRLMFYNNQGHYCPSTRDCTGAKYVEADFNKYLPVSHARVYVYQKGTEIAIGQGVSDINGYFKVQWNDFNDYREVYIRWNPIHKDGRFSIQTPSGNQWNFNTKSFVPIIQTTNSSPQQIGTRYWGSSSAPNPITNLYNGAWRMWNYALSSSARMNAHFNDLEIRAFGSGCNNESGGACAMGGLNRVSITNSFSAYGLNTILHEMGHIASYRANRNQNRKFSSDYNWPNTGDGGDWVFNGPEWAGTQFEEGLATFYGARAIYWQNAIEPYTCSNSLTLPCPDDLFNIADYSGPYIGPSSCIPYESRFPITVVRYLRRLYDNNKDINQPFYEFFDTINDFPGGIGNGDKDEAFCDGYWPWEPDYICDRNGRSTRDFRRHFEARTGIDTTTDWYLNCSPAGD